MPWVRAHYRRPRRRSSKSSANGAIVVLIAAFLAIGLVLKIVTALLSAGVAFVSEHKVAVAVLGLAAAITPLSIGLVRLRRTRALERLELSARSLCAGSTIPEPDLEQVRAKIRRLGPLPESLNTEFESLYRGEVARALDDRVLNDQERRRLDALARGLDLAVPVVQQAETEAFLEVYADAIADRKLTVGEEQTLASLRSALRLSEESIRPQLENLQKLAQEREGQLAELRSAQEIVRAELQPIQCPVSLRRGEVCYFSSPFSEKKLRVMRSQTIAGTRFSDKDLVAEREGSLYVTDKRLLLVADGTTSIALSKVLDVKVDTDTRLVSVIVDGRKRAHFFEVPQPFVFTAFLHRARDGG